MSVQVWDITPEHISKTTFLGVEITLILNGNPINLAGATISMDFNNGQHVFTNGSGITITDSANGVFQVDSQILAWEPGQYHYELWVTLANGNVSKPLMGTLRVSNG